MSMILGRPVFCELDAEIVFFITPGVANNTISQKISWPNPEIPESIELFAGLPSTHTQGKIDTNI